MYTGMEWTTESPRVAGWYWVDTGFGKPILLQYFDDNGEVRLNNKERTKYFRKNARGWLGPLPTPETLA